eukprot:11658655-Prorocentrum_lima.AAC.1
MTSSLVGSEMCIRDSPNTMAGGIAAGPGTDGIAVGPDSASEGGSLGPVSYTHLTLPTICSV